MKINIEKNKKNKIKSKKNQKKKKKNIKIRAKKTIKIPFFNAFIFVTGF